MLTVKAPAKINWSLYVLNRREDGYHNILSLMQCIGLYDTLTFEPSGEIELASDMELPREDNLVFKAGKMLRDCSGAKRGARIRLTKEIPSGAGLGGGSSDAAHTLKGLNLFWGLDLSDDELERIAARLGSDVPFFFHCPLAIAEGRGEVLSPLKADAPHTLLVIMPPVTVSTFWAYGEVAARRAGTRLTKADYKVDNIRLIHRLLHSEDMTALQALLHNDFEEAVIEKFPLIGRLKDELLEAGASIALMSGSGAAVFGLFRDREGALEASGRFSPYWHRVVETLIS